jgi:phosphate/sulfate permease
MPRSGTSATNSICPPRRRAWHHGRLEAHRRHTLGEKIGKSHLTYGQGTGTEPAAAAIFAADHRGLPVSTTHMLSSGVAGTMAADGPGLQWATVRKLALSGALFRLFRTLFAA